MKSFLKDAVPWLFIGVVVVNILYATGIIRALGQALAPAMQTWFGLPGEAATALLAGFLRKDLAVGMLLPLGMDPLQLVIAATLLTIYFPCAATFAVLAKELGPKDMLKATATMIVTAFLVGGVMRLILL